MKIKSIIIGIYAVLMVAGGIMGYLKAGSLASLMSGGGSGLLLIGCSLFVWKRNLAAYDIAIGILCCLLAFFSYRFISTQQVAPAGILLLMTTLVLIYLGRARPVKEVGIARD